MRRLATVLAVTLVVLAGFAPLAAAAPAGADATVGGVAATEQTEPTNESAPPDPETDRLGWENGYWYNESLDVNQSDGLTQAELNATVARAMARVEVIRGLEFNTTVPVEIISRSAFANSSGNRSYSEAFRAFDNAKFEALFLIGEDEPSISVQQSNRGATVGGYYSPAADSIVLVTDNETTLQVDELTLGHELVHAVQDQKFDLGNFSSRTRDGANANSGLIEGDANYVQQQYRERCAEGGAWAGSCLRPEASGGSGGGGGPANIGVYFLNYQPYSDGPAFIAAQKRRGGWEAVNDLYDAPPQSAEQVIHPERYGTDPPTEVELTDQHSEDWERIRPESRLDYAEVGQAGVASMFVYPWYAGDYPRGYDAIPNFRNTWLNYTDSGELSPIDPLNYGFDAAAGWDGDRMHFYQNDAGEGAYVWRLVWDSDAEATEFREAYEELLTYWGAEQVGEDTYRIADGPFADAFHLTVTGDTVTIVNAPSVGELSEVRSSVDAGVETPTPTAEPTATETPATGTTVEPVTEPSVTTESPGFSAITALLALLGAALLFRRR